MAGPSGTAAPSVISVSAAGNRPAPALPSASSFAPAGLPTAPVYGGVPASNYRSLRDTDNIYYPTGGGYIVFTASMVKINNGNRSYMVGTDGADSFDSGTYAQTGYFNNSLLVNLLGGGATTSWMAAQTTMRWKVKPESTACGVSQPMIRNFA